MEFVETALAKTGIRPALQTANGLFGKIAGPAPEEIELLLEEEVRIYRFSNQN